MAYFSAVYDVFARISGLFIAFGSYWFWGRVLGGVGKLVAIDETVEKMISYMAQWYPLALKGLPRDIMGE